MRDYWRDVITYVTLSGRQRQAFVAACVFEAFRREWKLAAQQRQWRAEGRSAVALAVRERSELTYITKQERLATTKEKELESQQAAGLTNTTWQERLANTKEKELEFQQAAELTNTTWQEKLANTKKRELESQQAADLTNTTRQGRLANTKEKDFESQQATETDSIAAQRNRISELRARYQAGLEAQERLELARKKALAKVEDGEGYRHAVASALASRRSSCEQLTDGAIEEQEFVTNPLPDKAHNCAWRSGATSLPLSYRFGSGPPPSIEELHVRTSWRRGPGPLPPVPGLLPFRPESTEGGAWRSSQLQVFAVHSDGTKATFSRVNEPAGAHQGRALYRPAQL
mmetsp:Transcript_18034/g.44954  ORF Transcript_18034/g.44954 Transcript_18034/m.44954 type:complete len:345 (-) Transcript_18034:79-1113(-)